MGDASISDRDCARCGRATRHEVIAGWPATCLECKPGSGKATTPPPPEAPRVAEYHCARCGEATAHQLGANGYECVVCRTRGSARRGGWTQRQVTVSVGTIMGLVALVIGGGFFHCVHGAGDRGIGGFTVIEKEEWGFYDQVVDVDDFVGKPVISLLDRARTVRALVRAEIISFPRHDEPE
jgi:hypothetical protein